MSKICIIIPCYNEEKRLNVPVYSEFISQNKDHFDFIFVNDGSKDKTEATLKKISQQYPLNCFVINLIQNSGKAEAVRQGINEAFKYKKYDYIAYFDADLATPLSEVHLLKSIIEHNHSLVMVMCSRIKRLGSSIERKTKRHILGRIFSTFGSIILKLPIYDTQCGAKLIKAEIIPYTFNEPFITKWLFDIEIIARIRNYNKTTNLEILYEHPISRWKDVGDSKLKLKHMMKVPFELLKIHRYYNKRN